MPKKPTVWFWKARKTYMTTIQGRRINLGPNKKAAQKEFHRLMGE